MGQLYRLELDTGLLGAWQKVFKPPHGTYGLFEPGVLFDLYSAPDHTGSVGVLCREGMGQYICANISYLFRELSFDCAGERIAVYGAGYERFDNKNERSVVTASHELSMSIYITNGSAPKKI